MITGLLIASLCTGMVGSYQTACQKASEAAGLQTGITQTFSLMENRVTSYGNDKGKYYLGDDLWNVGGVLGGIGIKVMRDHALEYKIHTKNYLPFDYVTPGVKGIGRPDQSGGSLGVGWTW